MNAPLKIEVCKRLMDRGHRPVIKDGVVVGSEDTPKYHACLAGKVGIWGSGDSIAEAIGSVIQLHNEQFNVEVEYLGELAR